MRLVRGYTSLEKRMIKVQTTLVAGRRTPRPARHPVLNRSSICDLRCWRSMVARRPRFVFGGFIRKPAPVSSMLRARPVTWRGQDRRLTIAEQAVRRSDYR